MKSSSSFGVGDYFVEYLVGHYSNTIKIDIAAPTDGLGQIHREALLHPSEKGGVRDKSVRGESDAQKSDG